MANPYGFAAPVKSAVSNPPSPLPSQPLSNLTLLLASRAKQSPSW
jgi:hypothetical protein